MVSLAQSSRLFFDRLVRINCPLAEVVTVMMVLVREAA